MTHSSKGIVMIYRVVDKAGREYVYVPQSKDLVKLPWNPETIQKLQPHFTQDTRFRIKDEKRGRTYGGSEMEWWINMDSSTLIESWIRSKDMRNERR